MNSEISAKLTNMLKMICPPFLKKGDKIGIVAPARKISEKELLDAFNIINDRGYNVVYSNNLTSEEHQFAGSDEMRAKELQLLLDDDSIKAIMFARGGYGCVRIVDMIDYSRFAKHPKWLIGYSDATVFHGHVSRNYGIQTMHATMPINFISNTSNSLDSLFDKLEGKFIDEEFTNNNLNRVGVAQGQLVGGNLSVLYSLLGSPSFPDTKGNILFLEDLDEYLYHIDRMMMGLKRAGKLSSLAGLLVGGMTQMNDNTIAFGSTAEEIIRDCVDEYNYPVYFGFPAGHIDDNRALIMGSDVKIYPTEDNKIVIRNL